MTSQTQEISWTLVQSIEHKTQLIREKKQQADALLAEAAALEAQVKAEEKALLQLVPSCQDRLFQTFDIMERIFALASSENLAIAATPPPPKYSTTPRRLLLPTPMVIASVCSSWRRLALAARGLWSSIVITDPDDLLAHEEEILARLDLWLLRSMPLRIHIDISISDDCEDWDSLGTRCLSRLLAHKQRWRSAILALPLTLWNEIFPISNLPLLTKLSLKLVGTCDDDGTLTGPVLLDAPALSHVAIYDNYFMARSCLPWNVIRSFDLAGFAAPLNLPGDVSSQFEKLTHLRLYAGQDDPLYTPQLNELPCLTYLSLCNGVSCAELQSLSFPSLQTLVIHYQPSLNVGRPYGALLQKMPALKDLRVVLAALDRPFLEDVRSSCATSLSLHIRLRYPYGLDKIGELLSLHHLSHSFPSIYSLYLNTILPFRAHTELDAQKATIQAAVVLDATIALAATSSKGPSVLSQVELAVTPEWANRLAAHTTGHLNVTTTPRPVDDPLYEI